MLTRESPEDAVIREMKEETGFICDSAICIDSLKLCPSRINNTLYFFWGRCSRFTKQKGTEDKESELILVTREEFKKMIVEDKYIEIGGIAMFLLAQLKGYL